MSFSSFLCFHRLRRQAVFSLMLAGALLLQAVVAPMACFAEGEDDPLWNRPSYEKKVIDVGQRILAANGIRERIAFYYNTKDIRNASAERYNSPNTVTIYKDMINVIDSDDELAAVLSHEIAHITQRHIRKIVPKKVAAKVGLYAVGAAAIVATGGLAAVPILAGRKAANANGFDPTDPLGKKYEKDADLVGLGYMVKAGYNPLAMETLWTKFEGDAGAFTTFWSSHPLGTERLTYIHEAIVEKYPQYLAAEQVQNPLPGSPYTLMVQQANEKDIAELNKKAAKAAPTPDVTSEPPPLQTKPTPRITEQVPETAQALPHAPNKPDYRVAATTASATTNNTTAELPNEIPPKSLAEVLLTLKPDELGIIRLLRQQGYLSGFDLQEQMALDDADQLDAMMVNLREKQLVRILGAEPDTLYVLTDWAARSLQAN